MRSYINILVVVCITFLTACSNNSSQVDLIVHNAKVYTVDSLFSIQEAFAVKNGKFVAIGTSKDILSAYQSDSVWDAGGQSIYPGFIDAHSHFFELGKLFTQADLTEATSMEEVIERLKAFRAENPDKKWLLGRGWDQNDWKVKSFPDKTLLDEAFPDVPVFLTRIDGHAALVNSKALEIAGLVSGLIVEGGLVEIKEGSPTGILIDNAMDLVRRHMPVSSVNEKKEMLRDAEKACFSVGLTSISDAGIGKGDIDLLDRMHKDGTLKIRNYAMIYATPDNLDYYLAKGISKTDRLTVTSFKIMADGALGSRGAMLLHPYSDDPTNFGLPTTSIEQLDKIFARIANSKFQVNTHCIGDSANRAVLHLYAKYLKGKNDRRWRIEHAQVIAPEDLTLFRDCSVIPSVQPTHATSDMYWAEDRLGEHRIETAYAFRELLDQNGMIALGSDFPVEHYNPLLGFYAAISRMDQKGYPKGGFQINNAISRQDALRGMTIWAAYANFEEKLKGSITKGKWADFVVLDHDIMEVEPRQIPTVSTLRTVIAGETVYLKK